MNNRMTRSADTQPESAAEQVAMLTHSLRVSRFTVVCGPQGLGKSELARAALFGQPTSGQPATPGEMEIPILFGQWSGDPTAALRNAITDAVDARTKDPATRPGFGRRSLADTLEYWSERVDARFVIVLDHFERNLEAEPMRSENASFTDELAVALNRPSLKANFLIVINDTSEGLLSRLTLRLGRLYDSFLRVGAPVPEKTPDRRPETAASRHGDSSSASASSIPRPAPSIVAGREAAEPRMQSAAASPDTSSQRQSSRPSVPQRGAEARREPRIEPAFFGRLDDPHSMVTPERFRAAEHVQIKRARRRRGWSTAGIALAGLATIALPAGYMLYRTTLKEPARYSALLESSPSSYGVPVTRRAIDQPTGDEAPQGGQATPGAGGPSSAPDTPATPVPNNSEPAATLPPVTSVTAPTTAPVQAPPHEAPPAAPAMPEAAPPQAATPPTPAQAASPAPQAAPALQAARAIEQPPAPAKVAAAAAPVPSPAPKAGAVQSAVAPQASPAPAASSAQQAASAPASAAASRTDKVATPTVPVPAAAAPSVSEKSRPALRVATATAAPGSQEGPAAPFDQRQRDAAAAATAALNMAAVRDLNLARAEDATPASPVPARDLKPLSDPAGRAKVFINIRSESQRAYANMVAQKLEHAGITVSGIAKVDRGPDRLDLRYYHPGERDEALTVQAALQREGVPAASPRLISGYEESAVPRNYELWLAPERN